MSMMPNMGAMMGGAMPAYGSIIQQLMGQAPAGFNQQLNEQQNYNPRGSAILNLLSQQGGAQLQQNQQGYQNELGQINQSMDSKGLANTTVGNNLDQGAANQLMQQNEAVNEKTGLSIADMAARLLPGTGAERPAKPVPMAPVYNGATWGDAGGSSQQLANGLWQQNGAGFGLLSKQPA